MYILYCFVYLETAHCHPKIHTQTHTHTTSVAASQNYICFLCFVWLNSLMVLFTINLHALHIVHVHNTYKTTYFISKRTCERRRAMERERESVRYRR